jgi:serine/threonine protein kinase
VAPALSQAEQQWLKEARSLSRLVHPHIVALFEADVFDGRAALVLELVSGPSLAQRLYEQGALPVADAVRLMIDVLDALQHAHDQGVVHRDLKPSNILLDSTGSAKVTDFGLAIRMGDVASQAGPHGVEGTPGYLSPEAARGEAPQPIHDVFAAGLVLAEMLTGKPMVSEQDPYRAVYRLAHEDLIVPHDPDHPLDDALRALVQRALARDPSLRHPSAAAFAQALREWLGGSRSDAEATHGLQESGNATLDFLLRRMRRTSDFPAMSEQIFRVQSLASSENESVNSLTTEILKDVALTNKLLRIVNSAHYAHVGGGHISTVSRAVSLIGFSGIRNLAMSLVLLDHMENKAHAGQLKGEFLRALMAASLAADMGAHRTESEEVFIGAMLQNLGRMLTEFYFPDEAAQIRNAMAANPGMSEERVSLTALGIGFEALGQGVGKAWGLPDSMLRLMRKPEAPPPSRTPTEAHERMQWIAMAANSVADTLLNAPLAELGTQLRKVASRYAVATGHSTDAIESLTQQAREKLTATADAMGLRVPAHSSAARLLKAPPPKPVESDSLTLHEMHQSMRADAPGQAAAAVTETNCDAAPASAGASMAERANMASAILATGIQDVTNAMVEDFKLNDVLRMILETMVRAMGFRQVLFCLKDPRTDTLQGRMGLGEKASETASLFKVRLNEANNLFAAVCNKGVDTLIHDASAANVSKNLPEWYRQHVHARSFILLPLMSKGAPLGLIYGDQVNADTIALDDKGLALLKTLRNQALMALRQSRGT